jgi:hypothetical protein
MNQLVLPKPILGLKSVYFRMILIPEFYRHGSSHSSPPDLADRVAFLESALGQTLAITLMLARQVADAPVVDDSMMPVPPCS